MTIQQISPYQILDSRGIPTLLVVMTSAAGKVAKFAVPAGSSLGKDESKEKRDGEGPYGGQGVMSCIELINTAITPKFLGYPLHHQKDFDELLTALDGSERKENLGGNTLLALSGAYLKLSALEKDQPLWQYIAEYCQTSPEYPRLFANIVGGGKHAPGLDIQEYMIVPQSAAPSVAISAIWDTYTTTRNIMENLYGPSALLVGDEGGLAPIGTSSEVILEALSQLNGKATNKFDLALDAAANTFYKNGLYELESQKLHASDLLKAYESWNTEFNLFSIEDPFAESDIEGTEIIKGLATNPQKPFLVFADDYTVTSKRKIIEMQQTSMFDGIIIKPNQAGTFTETFDAIRAARDNKAKVIISHRSGETTDSLLADLAYGVGAMGFKLGAPVRGERVAKYNRLLEIEADLDANQKQAGKSNVVAKPVASQGSNSTPSPIATPKPNQPAPLAYQPPVSPLAGSPLQTSATPSPTPTPVAPPVAANSPAAPLSIGT